MSNQGIYFPGLNGLRFFAATAVIFYHTEEYKKIFGLDQFQFELLKRFGKLGVTLFFVLSGFLITYLLLKEKEKFGVINLKKFYFRRLLRIWPLYFLIISLGIFVYPYVQWFELPNYEFAHSNLSIFLYYTFLPNIALFLSENIPFISLTWSIGVEEQFYILWPLFLIKFRTTYFSLISLLFVILIINFLGDYVVTNELLRGIFFIFKFSPMLIGGIFAYLLFRNDKLLCFLRRTEVQVLSYVSLIILIIFVYKKIYFSTELFSLLFSIVILNVSTNPKSIIKLETKLLNYLGKISFGLYVYHPVVIFSLLKISRAVNFNLNNLFLYTLVLIITILISTLSYYIYELKFLKLKTKFQLIKSGLNEEN